MRKLMKEFTLERLEDLKRDVESGEFVYVDDLHYELYNPIYSFSNKKEAEEQLLEYGVFKALDKVIGYEYGFSGKVYTNLSDPERLATRLIYILGEDFLFNADIDIYSIGDDGDERVTIEHIDHLIKNIDCIEDLAAPGVGAKEKENELIDLTEISNEFRNKASRKNIFYTLAIIEQEIEDLDDPDIGTKEFERDVKLRRVRKFLVDLATVVAK